MCADRSILEPNFVLPSHSSIAEFATIIAILHDNQASGPSRNPRPTCSSLLPPPTPTTIASSLNDLVPLLYGSDKSDEGRQQDPAEFVENLTFVIDGQVYTNEDRKQIATRVIFRTRLRDKALPWYQSLPAEVRSNWESLEVALLTQYALVPRKEIDQTRFLNLVFNLRQQGCSIVEYTRERDQLNAEGPEKFRDVLGHQFTAGLDDSWKVDLVQVYLVAKKSTVSYSEAKPAVEKFYQRFGEPSSFDNLNDQPFSPFPTPALQSEIVALLQSLRILQAALSS